MQIPHWLNRRSARKMLLKKQFVILFIICFLQYSSGFLALLKLINSGWEFAKFTNDVWFTKDTLIGFKDIITGAQADTDQIIEKLDAIHKNLNDLTIFTRGRFKDLEVLMDSLSDQVKIERLKEKIEPLMTKIRQHWIKLFNHRHNGSDNALFDSLVDNIDHDIQKQMVDFRSYIAPSRILSSDGLFVTIAKFSNARRATLCDGGETFHQTLTSIMEVVLSHEIMAQTLIAFAITWKFEKKNGRETELRLEEQFSKDQLKRYIDEYKRALKIGDTPFIRACDQTAGSWKRNETFLEFEGFIQQTLYNGSTGHPRCLDHPLGSLQPLDDHTYCQNPKNCEKFGSPGWEFACVYRGGPYRIQWATHTEEKSSANCPGKFFQSRFSSPWYFGGFCSCQCRSNEWRIVTDRLESKVDDNYVIVGVRFFRYAQKVISMQIAEGKLEPDGHISTWSWKQPRDLQYLAAIRTIENINQDTSRFFFDDLKLEHGHVLTGIHFNLVRRNNLKGYGIVIEGRSFNYATGKLNIDDPSRVAGDPPASEHELTYRARSSINMKPYDPHRIDSDGFTYINFGQSEIDHDFGQSTLPLLDKSPVRSDPSSPMGGVGLFHKGLNDWAGFIALRMFPINYTYSLNDYIAAHNLSSLVLWANPTTIK